MNIDVMRSYFKVNNCSERPLPGWRLKRYTEFNRLYPNLDVTEQNVVDRKDIIVKNKYLSDVEIGHIRRQVGNKLGYAETIADINGDPNEVAGGLNQDGQFQNATPTEDEAHTTFLSSL
ncbi:unnamed protein product [Acanthoscelides obtectus]|uniref:Uncharacterized protein n=1 Tax=Acanthoscelides obtectus TaxID=200917 RepID=A0A9P0K358_ACAOB|nr:unnamed protein product [Acanthoscelides obtectus]CAK1634199.1 hypothetical protein AOBTE_LOCUS8657 [Acanthoscelides obtectus]